MDVGDSYAPFGVQEGDGASEEKKGLRILAAAAVLTFGCLTMNAYAAEGWALPIIYGRILIKRKPRDE